MAFLQPRPSWHAMATCRGTDPDLWQSTARAVVDRLAEVCRACPVTEACLAQAMTSDPKVQASVGFWAGTSISDRRWLRTRGERRLRGGDVALFDAATGEVVIIEDDAPRLDPPQTRALLDTIERPTTNLDAEADLGLTA